MTGSKNCAEQGKMGGGGIYTIQILYIYITSSHFASSG